MTFQRLRMAVRLLTCFLILVAVAVQRNGSIFGHDVAAPAADASGCSPTTEANGVITINTSSIAGNIKGYGGPTPLEITIKDGEIAEITALKNAETEEFFSDVRDVLIPKWIGTPISEVADKKVDGISGATLSSNAVNATIKAAIANELLTNSDAIAQLAKTKSAPLDAKRVAVLIVVLCAAIIPLFLRDNRYRYIQLALNVVVLGFWSGTFLSYEVFVNYIAPGANLWQSIIVIIMLIVAFIYPYFGRKSYYCTWVCPLGSLQELAGKTTKFKLKLSPKLVKGLTTFQEILWFALMFLMSAGLWFKWMNYELFSAFIVGRAATSVLIVAGAFILLSVVVNRPFCRFVCPPGCLFQITQNPDK